MLEDYLTGGEGGEFIKVCNEKGLVDKSTLESRKAVPPRQLNFEDFPPTALLFSHYAYYNYFTCLITPIQVPRLI